MTFENLWTLHFFWILPAIVFILIFEIRKKREALSKFAENALISRLTSGEKKGKTILRIALLTAAVALLIFSIAGPKWGSHYQEVSQKGVDIFIAVDVSPSMLVEDVKPSRLERAKREILDFLKVVQGDRVGLAAFSGAAFVQCPLTLDYAACRMFLSELSVDLIPVAGTDIGAAIDSAVRSFDAAANADRVILLITDGEDNEGKGIEAAKKAAEKGIKIFIFGIGESTGAPVPSSDGQSGFMKDKRGKMILSKLDEESLKKIADATGGDYVRSVAGDFDLDILYFSGIKLKTDAAAIKSGKIKVYEERFMFFIFAAFILLLFEGFVDVRKAFKK